MAGDGGLKMSFKGPSVEDERKLHNEINQIGNQRFVLTTLARTLFGVLTAWMVPKDSAHQAEVDIGAFPFAISLVISVLLFSIYLWSHMLKNMMRVLTSYLAESGKSGWELDWREFRQDAYFAHTKPQTFMFLVLITMSIIFPFVLSLVFSLKITSVVVPASAVSLGLIVGLLIYLMGFKNLFDEEAIIVRRWKKMRSDPS
jgi:hypothetical protein